jgi:hypothetical protein
VTRWALIIFTIATIALSAAVLAQTQPATQAATSPSDADVAATARLRALIAASSSATAVPTSAPTTRSASATSPSTIPALTSKPMPNEYALLKTRSIFLKGRAPLGGAAAGGAATQPAPKRQEDLLVFNGATINEFDGQAVAFIEDTTTPGKVTRVAVGDALAHGKVARITLSQLDYEAGGKVTTIEIGQSLSGMQIGSSGTTLPSNPSAPDPNEDPIIARMRRARQEGR